MFKKIKILIEFLTTHKYTNRKKLDILKKKKLLHILQNHNTNFYPTSSKLEDFSIINKKIFMENFNNINTHNITFEKASAVAYKAESSRDFTPKIGEVSVGLSSGTSGNRGLFLVDENESARWAGYILKRMLPTPLLQNHKIAFFLRANNNLYESVQSRFIEFNFFDLLIPIGKHIKNLNTMQPTILIAPAQVLKLLAQNDILKINPIKIISVAEVLDDDTKKIVENRFKQIVHQVYQCTEGFLAHTCKDGHLHINEDLVEIEKEWIDKSSGRYSPIITDYHRSSQPVIRYKLDDILIDDDTPCSCGSVFRKIKKIEGRCDDILNMQTLEHQPYLLFPDFIRRAIGRINQLQEYKIIKEKEVLHIYLRPLSLKNDVENLLQELYKTHQIKALQHNYFDYEDKPLDIKLRRVYEI
jgi:putative adenylate-forming enzyme